MINLKLMKKFRSDNRLRGAAALITILVLGFLVGAMSFSTAIFASLENNSAHTNQRTLEAYYAAHSAWQDSLIKLQRNKDFFCSNCSMEIGAATVTINVANTGSSATITINSVAKGVRKKLQSTVALSTITGLITSITISETVN